MNKRRNQWYKNFDEGEHGGMRTEELLKTAVVYDFDGTLARGNLQECSFIPKMNMSRDEFWGEVKARKTREDADEILVYMHLMLQKAKDAGQQVTKQMLREHGQNAQLFPGLAGNIWFTRINEFAATQGLELQHFIVSSGIEEMIRGCPIQSAFERIYASKKIHLRRRHRILARSRDQLHDKNTVSLSHK